VNLYPRKNKGNSSPSRGTKRLYPRPLEPLILIVRGVGTMICKKAAHGEGFVF
jgi:hypothetical protein